MLACATGVQGVPADVIQSAQQWMSHLKDRILEEQSNRIGHTACAQAEGAKADYKPGQIQRKEYTDRQQEEPSDGPLQTNKFKVSGTGAADVVRKNGDGSSNSHSAGQGRQLPSSLLNIGMSLPLAIAAKSSIPVSPVPSIPAHGSNDDLDAEDPNAPQHGTQAARGFTWAAQPSQDGFWGEYIALK